MKKVYNSKETAKESISSYHVLSKKKSRGVKFTPLLTNSATSNILSVTCLSYNEKITMPLQQKAGGSIFTYSVHKKIIFLYFFSYLYLLFYD